MRHEQIKMIVTDLDGTLFRSDKTISEYTEKTLSRCRDAGIKVVYATGRSGSDSAINSDYFDARINMNGAIAKVGESVIYQRTIPYGVARSFLMSCDKRGFRVTLQSENMHYSNFAVSDVWSWINNYEIVNFKKHNIDGQKIYLVGLAPVDLDFISSILPTELYMVMANDGLLMIMNKEATKSKALSAVSDYWGINLPDIVAFGDDLNDIDMLSIAGVSIATSNAFDEVKAVADHICKSNDDDGVAKWLEENVLSVK